MTRAEIEAEYDIRDGRIVSPGKFEMEPVWAPYFYDFYMDGGADETDDEDVVSFGVDADDIAAFPELAGAARVMLQFGDTGFVSVWTETD